MTDDLRACLLRQLDTSWKLLAIHLDGLTTAECEWRPATKGPHVWRQADGSWRADWPDHEGYDLGPPSIAWITWHIGFWWSMALDHSFGTARLTREDVTWPGSADAVREWLGQLHERWVVVIESMTDETLCSDERTRWPFTSRPFADVAAWVNVELMKNAAEIGYARFLLAARSG